MASILSIDYGLKRIGLAISDPSRVFAFPYGVVENKNFNYVLTYIKDLAQEKEIDLIIVGVPLPVINTNNNDKKSMESIVTEFIDKLRQNVSIPIKKVDERYSSFAAEEKLREAGVSAKKSKSFVDAEAARLFLEDYLNGYIKGIEK